MIPPFPRFAPIDRDTIPDIASVAAGYAPYSEFNAINMWCWHAKYRDVSQLNGNLVLRFRDPDTGASHFSFIGTRAVLETTATLLAVARDHGVQPHLRLVPEVVVSSAPALASAFEIESEMHDTDYVLSIDEWGALEGSDYRSVRRKVAVFGRRSNAELIPVDLADHHTQMAMLGLFRQWAVQKGVTAHVETRIELAAFQRMLALAPHPSLQGFALVGEQGLLAFALCERVGGENVTLHFWKADRTVIGAYMTLLHRTCMVLAAEGYRLLNVGQDLGHAGMASAKQALRPCALLRKYALAERAA